MSFLRGMIQKVASQMTPAERAEMLRDILAILAQDVPASDRQAIVEHFVAQNNDQS